MVLGAPMSLYGRESPFNADRQLIIDESSLSLLPF